MILSTGFDFEMWPLHYKINANLKSIVERGLSKLNDWRSTPSVTTEKYVISTEDKVKKIKGNSRQINLPESNIRIKT